MALGVLLRHGAVQEVRVDRVVHARVPLVVRRVAFAVVRDEVPAGELHKYLGIRTVNYVRGKGAPALIDSTLVA